MVFHIALGDVLGEAFCDAYSASKWIDYPALALFDIDVA
jgi:hypothetical protein